MTMQIEQFLKARFPALSLTVQADARGIVTLGGACESWQQLIDVGHAVAAQEGVANVVSDMTVPGLTVPQKDYAPHVAAGEAAGLLAEADVVIAGLGIVGCAIARTLAQYNLRVVAVDMADDVATGATKANNGGVHHAGGVKHGTLKQKLSVRGNRMYTQLAKELGFAFERCGDLLFVEDPEDLDGLYDEFKTALRNDDYRPALLNYAQVLEKEPAMASYGIKPYAGAWLPSQGRVHTYEVAVALIENAATNGVRVELNCTVCRICTQGGSITGVLTSKGLIKTKYFINAAGVYADDLSAMAGDRCFTIHPRRGTIAIIDKAKPPMYQHLTGHWLNPKKQGRNAQSKGGGMEFTPSKNILIGPSATETPYKEGTETTAEELDFIMRINENPNVSRADIIRIFSGVRPADFKEDFWIEASPITHGLINAAAIQSPGVGASPAIAEMVCNLLLEDAAAQGQPITKNPAFQPIRSAPIQFAALTHAEQDALIKQRPEYGRIVCRCETITEGEILDAIRSPVRPTSIDAIKRRTRAGMGRCQGGFCQAKVLELLAKELGVSPTQITLKGPGTNILTGDTRPLAASAACAAKEG